jgi:hypothetical protein
VRQDGQFCALDNLMEPIWSTKGVSAGRQRVNAVDEDIRNLWAILPQLKSNVNWLWCNPRARRDENFLPIACYYRLSDPLDEKRLKKMTKIGFSRALVKKTGAGLF